MKDKQLTAKRQMFCWHYVEDCGGNGAEAYRRAYPLCKSGHKESASFLLTIPNICTEIERLRAIRKGKCIKNREQRQRFWSDTMESAPNICDKLRASELLGRSEADFTDNINSRTDDKPTELSEDERKRALEASKAVTGPVLSKETA